MSKKNETTPPKQKLQEKKTRLLQLTDEFCQKYLDRDSQKLCQKMIRHMSRQRTVPFLSGRLEIWAASIILVVGQVNFLFDKSVQPYLSHDMLHQFFGTTQSTVSNKARGIRKMLERDYFNDKYGGDPLLEASPLNKLVGVNGVLVTIDSLPPELQMLVEQMGITEFETIPFNHE